MPRSAFGSARWSSQGTRTIAWHLLRSTCSACSAWRTLRWLTPFSTVMECVASASWPLPGEVLRGHGDRLGGVRTGRGDQDKLPRLGQQLGHSRRTGVRERERIPGCQDADQPVMLQVRQRRAAVGCRVLTDHVQAAPGAGSRAWAPRPEQGSGVPRSSRERPVGQQGAHGDRRDAGQFSERGGPAKRRGNPSYS
jgi:hypothetical protein